MKRTRLIWMMALVAAIAGAQSAGFAFEDVAKNLTIRSKDGRGSRTSAGYHVVLRGNVLITLKSEGTRIRCDLLEGDILAGSGPGQLQRAVATGNFRLVKDVQSPTGKQSTDIQSSKANYRYEKTQTVVDFPGTVHLQNFDASRNQSLDARGNRGSAILVSGGRSSTSGTLRSADLVGNVKVVVTEANSAGQSKLVASSGKMHLDALSNPRRIVLTDQVNVKGQGTNRGFQVQNQKRVVLTLNDKNEVSSWTTEAGS